VPLQAIFASSLPLWTLTPPTRWAVSFLTTTRAGLAALGGSVVGAGAAGVVPDGTVLTLASTYFSGGAYFVCCWPWATFSNA
jgi:hypothetical protein